MKTAFEADILLAVDRASGVSLRLQLEREMRAAIRSGRLPPGLALPSSRSFASTLGVSRGVVVGTYEQLIAEGYLVSQLGSGTTVAAVRTGSAKASAAPPPRVSPRFDFLPGMPDLGAFPTKEWLSCARRAVTLASKSSMGYPDAGGPRSTREELANFLARSRATAGGPENLVLCSGFTQGIDLVARLLAARQVKSVAIEDPGLGGVAHLFRSLRIKTPRIPVDERGMVVERLARSAATAVVVTPAHQYPTGAGMAPERRAALLEWAFSRNALIIEDDYDAEFRYDRQPIGALQGLAPDHVIYIGSASKTLSPALRIGWTLAPSFLVQQLSEIKQRADRGSPTFDLLALGDFIGAGHLDRHLKKMRSVYGLRRDALITALAERLPGCSVHGVAAGLHLMVSLPLDVDERALVAAAREASIEVLGVYPFHARPEGKSPALLMGYGGIETNLISEGIERLAGLVAAVRR
jgi:GntR family transcriptional regulator / MocR family aminotransferase